MDGFGELLRACWRSGPRPGVQMQVIERDDGFVSVEDAYRYFTRANQWPTSERRAVQEARGRVLDVGCAVGRHMLALEDRCEVVGIDPSAGAVRLARERGLDARPGTALRPGDIGTFDTIVLLGGNLGLLGSAEHAPKVLESLGRVARPGARLLAIGRDPYIDDHSEHRAYHERNRAAGRLPGQVRMRVRYRGQASDWFDRLLISPSELIGLVNDTSWAFKACSQPDEAGFFLAELRRAPGSGEMRTMASTGEETSSPPAPGSLRTVPGSRATAEPSEADDPGNVRLTAEAVRSTGLVTSRLRPGYVEEEVDAFLDRVEQEIALLTRERDEARAEIARLRDSRG